MKALLIHADGCLQFANIAEPTPVLRVAAPRPVGTVDEPLEAFSIRLFQLRAKTRPYLVYEERA